MTLLDISFGYIGTPGESEMRAIDSVREVYGIRKIQFDEAAKNVKVEFDASRFKAVEVARLLRQAGIDLAEQVGVV